MPTLVHEYDWPDRVVIGTVGRPGERTFYLQARTGARSTSVALEKEQSAVLAETIDEVLSRLASDKDHPVAVPAEAPAELIDNEPLDQPVEEQFRAGMLRLGWEPRTAQVVIEAYPVEPDDDDDDETDVDADGEPTEPSEMLLIRIPVGTARAFVERTRQVVRAGRPICPLCGQPIDPDGHVCDLTDPE
ncbi:MULTISPECIES: DUF3090 domain-containing protein [unclassified Actinotalea]|uniref:DUF3090 domain-containing protein n=1 Tax=unclassified Actinotalea TaxID=2638618 RepID=UPI0015F588B3|nr:MULTISPECIES: DUF3090 domain-containing protein [unclassified Actinotalea]